MPFADKIESELSRLIDDKLKERSGGTGRAWLNPGRYPGAFSGSTIAKFDSSIKIKSLEEHKILCVEYAHELIHFDDEKIDKILDDLCEKIEKYFIDIVKNKRGYVSPEYNLRYREAPIQIEIGYRFFTVKYYVNFYNW
jgi:hypothetical protein